MLASSLRAPTATATLRLFFQAHRTKHTQLPDNDDDDDDTESSVAACYATLRVPSCNTSPLVNVRRLTRKHVDWIRERFCLHFLCCPLCRRHSRHPRRHPPTTCTFFFVFFLVSAFVSRALGSVTQLQSRVHAGCFFCLQLLGFALSANNIGDKITIHSSTISATGG